MTDDPQPYMPIVIQTGRFVVVDKPADFRSVPGLGETGTHCVANRIKQMFPAATGPLTVHRLDMATSGLLILALDPDAHRTLSAQFEARTVRKRYTALLGGVVDGDEGEVSVPLRPDYDNRPVQIVDFIHGKPALSRWRVLERGVHGRRTRVEFEPVTGRSHQLRVHAAHPSPGGLGAPIVGDTLYGGEPAPRLMLHAEAIEFDDPDTRERVQVTRPAPF